MNDPATQRTDLLAAWLSAHDGHCPSCRRRVTSAPEQRCPHCRTRLSLGLDSTGANGGGWLAGVIAAGTGTGFFAVITALIGPDLIRGSINAFDRPLAIAGLVIGMPLMPGLLIAWFVARRRIRAWAPRRVRLAAVLTAVSVLAVLTLIAVDT